jgi:hypothetical protein
MQIEFRQSSEGSRAASSGFLGWKWLVLLAVAVVTPLMANAQLSGKGAITGTVTDKTGAVIPDAAVAVTSTSTGITVTTKSTGAGDYNLSNLDPGVYTIAITATGFEKLTQQNVHVNALESQTYNPVLTVGATDVQITVTAEPPQLETSNATLGATMEQETYSELPLEMGAFGSADQRRATDFVYLMPGVQGNETNGNATTNTGVVNGSGSRGAVSDVYIDGIPFVRAGGNGDPRYVWTAISVDAVDQFQLQTSGYSAIYEGQGVMNYSVKQGSSTQHGAVYEFFRNTALDTWGFFGKAPNPATGLPVKPVEHSNEYGINLGGPLIPFGTMKNKLFYFTNYNGFRYSSATPTPMTFPTAAEQSGNFSAVPVKIYDPFSEAACAAANTANNNAPCRNQFSYNGVANVIPPGEISTVAKNLQSFMSKINPASIGSGLQNNFIAPNATGLVNWSTTSRIDYILNSHDTITGLGAVGRQASSVPVGQTTAGRNVGPVPYNYGQAYAPKTAVWTVEETHVFSPNLLNQVKWGYARYNGPTFNPDASPTYAASALGMSGLPGGQAAGMFPIVSFAGTDAPTQWNGATENSTVAENYTVLDNVQWNVGKHSFTFGGQVAWLLYNVNNATGGSTPITLANAVTETAALNNGFTAVTGTGLSYASFLVGEIDKGSFTQYLQQEFGARFRAISPYAQDDWKITPKLTLNLGLRYDFFPTVTEVHNAESFFNPKLANPITGINGALEFTGKGAGTCNCSTPVNSYFKNFGPRVGLAYQLGSKTVIRASYGVMFTHGNAVGGLNTSIGTLGFSAAPSFSANGSLLSTIPLTGTNGAIPAFAPATGVSSGPAYGTGFTGTANYTGTPSSMQYDDAYLGGRAPEFINWTFGVQRQLTDRITLTASYVGSEGHFLQTDGGNGRGFWSDALDPKYLYLGPRLADTGKTATTVAMDCVTYTLPCPANFTTAQSLAQALKPFPFQTVSDSFGQYMGNANYHALQMVLSARTWRGLTFNANYTFSKAIDDGGTFRSGYAIPAGTVNNSTKSYAADRIDRSLSTSNQPQHFVATSVWNWPLGQSVLAGSPVERAVLGGFAFSGVYQIFAGSPLAITVSSCQTNPAQSGCPPALASGFTGSARQNGKWGDGVTLANYASHPYINSTAFTTAPNYTFGNAPRTAPYNLFGPGYYQVDLAMVRSFPLHITEATRLKFRAEWYNVTNHTQFAVASSAFGNATFGTVTQSGTLNRKAAQFSARVEF